MRKSRFTPEQIIQVLHEAEAGAKISEVCRRHGITETTFQCWRRKFGGLQASAARRRKALEDENRQLKSAPPHVRMHVWSIDAGVDVHSLDFSATDALIDAAYNQTMARLAALSPGATRRGELQ